MLAYLIAITVMFHKFVPGHQLLKRHRQSRPEMLNINGRIWLICCRNLQTRNSFFNSHDRCRMREEFNPFQSPELAYAQPLYPNVGAERSNYVSFASGHVRAVFTMAFLALMAVGDAVGCFACYTRNDLLDAFSRGQQFPYDELAGSDKFVRTVAVALALGTIVTAIAYLMWMHRAYRNLPALGAQRLNMTPAWAVGWWFVPFANLFKPYQSTAEIWRYSDPKQADKLRKSASVLVAMWWGAFLVRGCSYQIATFLAKSTAVGRPTFASLENVTTMKMITYAIEMVAAIIAIAVVNEIDQNQKSMNQLVRSAEQTSVPAGMSSRF